MEDIFKKLCKIAAGIEADQKKIKAKVGYTNNCNIKTQGLNFRKCRQRN